MQNEQEVLKRLLALSEYFKENLSETVQDIYLTALSKYDDDKIFKAIEESYYLKFFPRLYAFKNMLECSEDEILSLAWENVLKEIRLKGITCAKFDNETTRALNACGGVEAIGHCDIDKLDFKRKAFVDNYKVFTKNTEYKEIENKEVKQLTDKIGYRRKKDEESELQKKNR